MTRKNLRTINPGEQFERLTVLGFCYRNRHGAYYACQCECFNLTVVMASRLFSGHTKSCGCLSRDTIIEYSTKHGLEGSPEYNAYYGIRARCYNENEIGYKHYGGRGITVCARWLESFENFFIDMGPRPSSKYSIDRRNNNGNYEPDNCYWATKAQQMRNYRRNVSLTYKGETLCLTDWSTRLGIHFATISSRLKNGASVEEAFTRPVQNGRKSMSDEIVLEIKTSKETQTKLAARYGVARITIRQIRNEVTKKHIE